MARIGFIGLGVMGGRITERLLTKGHTVTGYNRTRARAHWLIERGMHWADSPCEVASASDFIFAMVTNAALPRPSLEAPRDPRRVDERKDLCRYEHGDPNLSRALPQKFTPTAPTWSIRPSRVA